MEDKQLRVSSKATVTASAEVRVRRGAGSWAYIYVALGFLLSLSGTVIQLIKPLEWPYNLILYVVICFVAIYFFLFNGWFQNQLLKVKTRYEDVSR